MRHVTLLLALVLSVAPTPARADYVGSRFSDVWSQVASDPYPALPQDAVSLDSFYGFLQDRLLAASRRTLSDRSDLLPRFRKLVHPNGICFAGTWSITATTPYSGYFRTGARGLFIGRASTALTETERGSFRAFGFAGKIFPTLDPNAVVPTANFFTIENLGGTLREHYLDALNTNDILFILPTPEGFMNTAIGAAAAAAFSIADHTLDVSDTLIRQLYPIAELGEPDPARAVGPKWLLITGASDVPRVDAADFRDELRLKSYPAGLRFDIQVADLGTRLGPKQWVKIGTIDVSADAVTDSCDHRLHFAHPRYRR
jgi:hypothetical protein